MLEVNNLSLQFGKSALFKEVNIKFTPGNCYGVIGANGAGKSTFLRLLSGDLEPTTGYVTLNKNARMSVLNQNQNAFDAKTVLETVFLGHKRLYEIMQEKEVYYAKTDFTDEDGIALSELEAEFSDLDGWEADSKARMLLNGLKIEEKYHDMLMSEMDTKLKVKVLLAQAVFGNPDVLILDEPTNNLDIKTVRWLEDFLIDFPNTVIIVSHNRHFLNKVCTHICDVDFQSINIYLGNYDFWYETSQLLARQAKDANKKAETRAAELKEFIARFSANASKSRQATSRKKELEKLTLEDIRPSSRRYPFIDFKYEREIGNDVLVVENLTKKGYFKDVSFMVIRGEKIAFLSDKSVTLTMLFDILAGKETADSGKFKFGQTITVSYLPQDNRGFFEGNDDNLVDWLKQYSKDTHEEYLRGWLGRMLFSGDDALKKAKVLSGGERVRCMLSRSMLGQANFLIMDEPTNHLDLESITALNKGMANFRGCMLFTSHDHELMGTVANRIIEINETKTFDKLLTYDEYLELALADGSAK